ncbi:MAG: DUF1554 domain-containing protein [bacterium]|nr:DUF1554 domain-containing protein [bacterium]
MSGTLTGLAASRSIAISNNDGDVTAIDADGEFTFEIEVAHGGDYSVTINAYPIVQDCTVSNGDGDSISANVTDVSIECDEVEDYVVFVTDAAYIGNLGGISGADDKCNAHANKPNNSGDYKAMLVLNDVREACQTANCTDGGIDENIDWVLKPNTNYVRPDLARIMTTNDAGIFPFGTLENPWVINGTVWVFTGVHVAWITAATNCNG